MPQVLEAQNTRKNVTETQIFMGTQIFSTLHYILFLTEGIGTPFLYDLTSQTEIFESILSSSPPVKPRRSN